MTSLPEHRSSWHRDCRLVIAARAGLAGTHDLLVEVRNKLVVTAPKVFADGDIPKAASG
jgi:hypothetical protein